MLFNRYLFIYLLNEITADILVVLRYRVKRSMRLVFWYQQRLVHTRLSLIFLPKLTHAAAGFVCDS